MIEVRTISLNQTKFITNYNRMSLYSFSVVKRILKIGIASLHTDKIYQKKKVANKKMFHFPSRNMRKGRNKKNI